MTIPICPICKKKIKQTEQSTSNIEGIMYHFDCVYVPKPTNGSATGSKNNGNVK